MTRVASLRRTIAPPEHFSIQVSGVKRCKSLAHDAHESEEHNYIRSRRNENMHKTNNSIHLFQKSACWKSVLRSTEVKIEHHVGKSPVSYSVQSIPLTTSTNPLAPGAQISCDCFMRTWNGLHSDGPSASTGASSLMTDFVKNASAEIGPAPATAKKANTIVFASESSNS